MGTKKTLENLELNTIEKADIDYIHRKLGDELKILSGKKILITGASGFLSYYFILSLLTWNDLLKNDKIHLTLCSRFKNGLPNWLKKIQLRKDIKIIKKDITKLSLSQSSQFDYIIHAASIASPIVYRKYPLETMKANVEGLTNLLKYSIKRKKSSKPVKGILYFSSSEIYGDPSSDKIPTPENYNGNVSCTGPRACYDESKRYCETLCVNYVKVHGLPIKVARPFNNYGPGLKIDDGRVIPDFAKNIFNNTNIVMHSDGDPKRTFCYVSDAIIGYIKILVIGKTGEAYNIGIEKPEISIKELAQTMVKIGKKKLNYTGVIIIKKSEDKHYLTDNPQRRCPVIQKAILELDYNPEVSINLGLEKILLWYKEFYKY